jgi:hypothetical protein
MDVVGIYETTGLALDKEIVLASRGAGYDWKSAAHCLKID